jgi:hypothetical protein
MSRNGGDRRAAAREEVWVFKHFSRSASSESRTFAD